MTATHTPAELLDTLTASGVRLEARGVRILIDAPKGVLTAELRNALTLHKTGLIAALRLDSPCDNCGSTGTHSDVPIHDGRSTRRDCGRCGRTQGFPQWNPEAERR